MAKLMGIAALATSLFPLLGATQLVAHTAQATYKRIRGSSAVDAHLGTPYADPPIGQLRFAPPQPIQQIHPRGMVGATGFGPVCHQFHYRTVLGDNLLETSGQSEDCLTLNIFVPRRRSRKYLLPVYVWSHRGAFVFNPTGFVEANNDIITVTWNYRLRIFGFPAAPGQPTNLGLRDQRLGPRVAARQNPVLRRQPGPDRARRPVDRRRLGGGHDSGLPEYMGESDGSEWRRLTAAVGCRMEDIDCMRKVPAETLQGAWRDLVVDNLTQFRVGEYTRRGREGRFARVATLMGILDNKGDGTVNRDPDSWSCIWATDPSHGSGHAGHVCVVLLSLCNIIYRRRVPVD
ncbi:alpha/beta-hydrolase [Parathielavia hyrcaniae]|uniref:Alpha/beta-hydrolase n=1 Tax=Parathielavia hyrcaniae TaxID=113614 RepID=A0AAN6SWL9_9PEZI|nr:alpha/beta-hydrolase [Parathielavia hyrcaniae]